MKNYDSISGFFRFAVIIIASTLLGLLLSITPGCRPCRQVATESAELTARISGDTLRDFRLRIDSVIVRDSVLTWIKGDTVIIDRSHKESVLRLRVDTIEKIRNKTLLMTRSERITVAPREPPWYRQLWPWLFAAMTALAGYGCGIVWRRR